NRYSSGGQSSAFDHGMRPDRRTGRLVMDSRAVRLTMGNKRRDDMPQTNYTPAEIGRIGREIYHRDLRPKVEPENVGRFIAIDIRNGDYEIGDDEMKVVERYLTREPDG